MGANRQSALLEATVCENCAAYSMITGGFRPRQDTTNFIEWDSRDLNTYADHAANLALDLGTEWEKKNDAAIAEAKSEKASFLLCCDGAFRKGGSSAAGVAFFSYIGGTRTLLLIAGRPMGFLSTSFVSDLLALEMCLARFMEL